ncbi:MAG: biotin/lipoyl-containing protein [Desulfomonilaceae bacterium]
MEYKVKIGPDIYTVDAAPLDDSGCSDMVLEGETRAVTVRAVAPNHLHLRVGCRTANLFVARTSEGSWIWIDGRARLVQDADVIERRKARGPGETPGEVTPPTPASVVRVLVEVGREVVKGQGLIVVSAMKMEMTLAAPYSGTVRAVNTQVGAQVSPGEILVEIDALPGG